MTCRSGLLAGSVASLLVAGALAAPPGSASAAHPLEPDLRPEPASDLTLEYSGSTRSGLRLTTTIRNEGAGPLELFPIGGVDCDGDGNAANDRLAHQRVFEDSDDDGVFDPAVDTSSTSYSAGCMIYHAPHDHWHFEDFSDFELLTPSGGLIAATDKVSFCLTDTSPFDLGLPGAPAIGDYTSCQADSTEGISVGWRDTYESSLPGQRLDIAGASDGDYCVAVTSDPDNLLRESDDSNNTSLRGIMLSGGTIIDSPGSCVAGVQATTTVSQLTTSIKKRQRCKRGKKRGGKRRKPCRRKRK